MPKKKIYDIVPPGKRAEMLVPKIKHKVKETRIKDPSISAGEKKAKPAFVFSKKKGLLIAVLIIIVFGFYWLFSSANVVRIELSPKLSPVAFSATLAFSTSTDEFDLSFFDLSQVVIPAIPMEFEETFNKQFSSSEVSIEEKAQGTIRVYNNHGRSISLVTGTRFLSSSEPTRQFHSKEKINIPASGHVDVSVIASEADESYNIEACAFSIPGLRNYSPPQLYYDVFGRSFSKMEGGRKDVIRKATEQAMEDAKAQLLESSKEEIRSILENKVAPDYIILDDTIQLNLIQAQPLDVKVGQETDTFVYQIRVKVTALKVKTAFLLEFARNYISSTLPANKEFVEDFVTLSFLSKQGGAKRELSADLEFSTKVHSPIDKDSLKEIVKGRSRRDISRYILEICPELSGPPKIEFSPFWARRAAVEPDRIEIEANFE
jgi:hypothetical protein